MYQKLNVSALPLMVSLLSASQAVVCDNIISILIEWVNENSDFEGTLLIPCNSEDAHWAGLVCKFQGGVLKSALFFDSFPQYGEARQLFQNLSRQLSIYPDVVMVNRLDGLIQDDGSSCGACMIENLFY